jgi:hypothetical protein
MLEVIISLEIRVHKCRNLKSYCNNNSGQNLSNLRIFYNHMHGRTDIRIIICDERPILNLIVKLCSSAIALKYETRKDK